MTVTGQVLRYELRGALRARWLIAYALFFLIATDALLRFGGAEDGVRAVASLMNVALLVVPLVTTIFGTIAVYNAREFTELLLAQPVARRDLYAGLYLGLALPSATAFLVGVGVPFALHGGYGAASGLATLLLVGVALTAVFSAIAFLIATRCEERVRGLGVAIGVWLAMALLYDGAVLLLATLFADYPLERPLLALMVANPIDLARVALLLRLDSAALMGYTGAVFKQVLGGTAGITIAVIALGLWTGVPVWLGRRAFERKDF